MARSEDKREGRVMLSVWVETEIIRAIDRRVAEIQQSRTEKVHRSDVVREVLGTWAGIPKAPSE